MRTRKNVLSLTTISLVALIACGNREGKVRICVFHDLLECFPVYACERLGYFREEGADVSIEAVPSSKGIEAVAGGSADIAYATASGVIHAAAQGKLVTIFFVGQRTGSAILVVTPSKAHRIQRISDLAGATIGVASLGSAQHSTLLFFLRKHGVDPETVRIIAHGNGPAAAAAIEHGVEDAGLINGSALVPFQRRLPGLRILADPRTRASAAEYYGSGSYVNFSLISTPSWLRRNPETARKIARAMTRTLAWIRSHEPRDMLPLVPEHLRSADPEADIETLRLISDGLSEDGRMPEGGPELLLRIAGAKDEDLRRHGISLSGIYTNEFLPR